MCKRVLLGALCSIATLSAPARAQTPGDVAQKRRAVEIAARAYVAARAARDREESARLQLPLVRTYAGLEVRADTSFVPAEFLVRLDSGFARARQHAAAVYGVTTDSLLARAGVILSRNAVPVRRLGGPLEEPAIRAEARRPTSLTSSRAVGNERWRLNVSIDRLEEYFIVWFEHAAATRTPPSIVTWMGTHTSVHSWTASAREAEHFGLVMHASGIGLACANGAIAACRTSFALMPNADSIGAWFDAETRRAHVVRALEMRNVRQAVLRTHAEAADRCTEIGDDAACRAVLVRIGVRSPTSRASREQLVRLALLRGGEHAFERMQADTAASVERALTRAAGVPLDSLLVPWRESILAGRPPSPAPNLRELLLGLALMGSLVGLTAARKP